MASNHVLNHEFEEAASGLVLDLDPSSEMNARLPRWPYGHITDIDRTCCQVYVFIPRRACTTIRLVRGDVVRVPCLNCRCVSNVGLTVADRFALSVGERSSIYRKLGGEVFYDRVRRTHHNMPLGRTIRSYTKLRLRLDSQRTTFFFPASVRPGGVPSSPRYLHSHSGRGAAYERELCTKIFGFVHLSSSMK